MTPLLVLELGDLGAADPDDQRVTTAIQRAINKTADRSRTRAAEMVRQQIAFPASYLGPSGGRLQVSKRARSDSLEALVEGRDRATSLARFAKGGVKKGGEIKVSVKPGVVRGIRRAWLMSLKNGNVGLAVRTNGGAPSNAYKPKEVFPNVWLLYGPSVDQALMQATDGGGVFESVSDEMLELLNDEFNRQLDLLNVT